MLSGGGWSSGWWREKGGLLKAFIFISAIILCLLRSDRQTQESCQSNLRSLHFNWPSLWISAFWNLHHLCRKRSFCSWGWQARDPWVPTAVTCDPIKQWKTQEWGLSGAWWEQLLLRADLLLPKFKKLKCVVCLQVTYTTTWEATAPSALIQPETLTGQSQLRMSSHAAWWTKAL